MRRALKFKASVFLLAWLTFFAHNVIPHNHVGESSEACKHLIHNSFSCTTDEDRPTNADREHSDGQVCHLSNFLFHTVSPEIIFLACSDRNIGFIPDLRFGKIYVDGDHSNNPDKFEGISCLRAPPAV